MIMMYRTFESRMKKLKGAVPDAVNRLTFSKDEDMKTVLAHDPLSEQVSESEWTVTPVAMHKGRLFAVCPFCGAVHVHGASDGTYSGARIPDCHSEGFYHLTPIIA